MPCARKSKPPSAVRLLLEDLDERLADDLPLALGIHDAGEPREEQIGRVDELERQLHLAAKARADLRRLVQPQHAVVHEDAGEPVADRAMDQQRRDRRVDAAAEARRRPCPSPTCCANARGRLLDERGHRPVAGAAADVEGEIARGSRARGRCGRLPDGTAGRRAARSASSIAATGALALVATTRKPGGAAST